MGRMYRHGTRVPNRVSVLSAALASLLFVPSVQAMDFHIFGDKIYATGDVQASDGAKLRDLYATATTSGRTITTVVFRNSPGGSADGGLDMSSFIRENGLSTIFQGGCYSACALAFTGGVQRGVADFDLPAFSFYDRTTLGYHGGSINGVPASDEIQQFLYDFVVDLFGPDVSPGLLDRLHTAHFGLEESNGFLRYLDPNFNANATIFCPTVGWLTGNENGCTTYEGVDYYTDGVVTRDDYQAVEDILDVRSTVSGDLNPNFGDDLADSYGVIRVGNGGTWNLATNSFFDITWVDGGRLNLQDGGLLNRSNLIAVGNGGVLNLDNGNLVADGVGLTVLPDGTLSGKGYFHGAASIFGTLAPSDIQLRPYALDDRRNGLYIALMVMQPGSTTAISVDPERTTPALSIVDAEVRFTLDLGISVLDFRSRTHGILYVDPTTRLAVDFTPGFYRPGQVIPLIAGVVDPTVLTMPEYCSDSRYNCLGYDGPTTPAIAPYVSGHFGSFVRLNDGRTLDLGEDGGADFIPVGDDSLLGFSLEYDAMPDVDLGGGNFLLNNSRGIYLTAQRAFDDVGLFGNDQSGDGLGVAIRNASDKTHPGIEPLLGALQFSTRKAAREQSGALRGDAFTTLQLADRGVVSQLDSAQRGRWLMAGSRATDNDLAQGQPAAGIDAANGTEADAMSDSTAWIKLLGTTGRIETRQGVEGLSQDLSGIMVGIERGVASGDGVFGVSLAHARNDVRSPSRRFASDSDVFSGSLYGDVIFGRSMVDISARYSRIKHDTERSVHDIAGLEAPGRARFNTDALSLHVGHAYQLSTNSGTQLRLLAPVIDHAGLDGYSISERSAPVALNADIGSYSSWRVGGGFDLQHAWSASGGGETTARARLLYQREVGDTAVGGIAAFSGESELPFAVRSQDSGRDILAVDLGLTMKQTSGVSLSVEYSGELSKSSARHAAFIGVGYRF